METETRADAAYTWTVRALYLVAIGLNVYYLVAANRDTPEVQSLLARGRRVLRAVRRPIESRREWTKAKTAVVLEAWGIVEKAKEATE